MASPATPPRGIVLFAHGSRDPLWCAPIEAVAAQIRACAPEVLVSCAYLELTAPDLPAAAAGLIARGAAAITVVPLFLGVGRHAREDLPQLIAELRRLHPQVQVTLQPAIGEDPRLTALMAQIALAPP